MRNEWLCDIYMKRKTEEYKKTGERIIFKQICNPEDKLTCYYSGLDIELNDNNRAIVKDWTDKHGTDNINYMILKGKIDKLTLVVWNLSSDYSQFATVVGEARFICDYLEVDPENITIQTVGYLDAEKSSYIYEAALEEGFRLEHVTLTPKTDEEMIKEFINFKRNYTREKINKYKEEFSFVKYFYDAVLPVSERIVGGFEVEVTDANKDKIDSWINEHGYEGYPIDHDDAYGECKVIVFHQQEEGDFFRNDVRETMLTLAELIYCADMDEWDVSAEIVGAPLSRKEDEALKLAEETGFDISDSTNNKLYS